jgi:hypothetical protein
MKCEDETQEATMRSSQARKTRKELPPREEIHSKPSVKSRDAATRLKHYLDTASDGSGRPPGHEKAWKNEPTDGAFAKVPAITPEEFLRLKFWLQEFIYLDDAESYAALLQVWLSAHGIPWPTRLFSKRLDYSLPGAGRPPNNSDLGWEAKQSRAEGDKWKDVSKKHAPPRYQIPSVQKKAADRVRRAAERYNPRIDLALKQLGHEMLGTMMREDGEHLLREIIGAELQGEESQD